jgi:GH24 family phage-related lysozyme (muramidase)
MESLRKNRSNRTNLSKQTVNKNEPKFELWTDLTTGTKYWRDLNDPVTSTLLDVGPNWIKFNYYGSPDKTPQRPPQGHEKFGFSWIEFNDEKLTLEPTKQTKPIKVTPYPNNVTTFDTVLLPAEEQAFLLWKNEYAPNDSGQDYDLRGAFKAGLKPDATGHWPDDWKKPSHPTFSTDSVYASVKPNMAGTWYDAPADNKYPENAIIDENTGQYFIKPNSEKNNKQISPGAVREKPTGWWDIITATDGSGEGLKLNAYQDAGGVWTIGLGTTRYLDGTPVKKGDTITKEQAEEYANAWVETKVIPRLSETIPTWNKMTPQQQGALISFAYNFGENFYGTNGYETITKALSKVENFKDVPKALALYNKGYDKKQKKKVVMNGLVKRRKAEADLWSSK